MTQEPLPPTLAPAPCDPMDRQRWLERNAADAAGVEGCELIELAVKGSGAALRVILTIDRPGGVTVEDCARMSRRLRGLLETAPSDEGSFILEVSSPGLTRRLTSPADFRRFQNRLAVVETREPIAGRKHFRGEIQGSSDAGTTVELLDQELGQPVALPWSAVAWARLDFDLPGAPKPAGRKAPAR